MWTVTVSKKQNADGGLTVQLTYTNEDRIVEQYLDVQGGVDDAYIAAQAQAKIDWLTTQDETFAAITEGPVMPQLTSPSLVATRAPEQLQADTDKTQFLADYQSLQQYNRAIAAGVATNQDADYIALQKQVQGEFKIDYLALI